MVLQNGRLYHLKNIDTASLLPFITNTTERNKGVGIYDQRHLRLGKEDTIKVQNFAQQYRLTVNTLLQATWAYLLHRYTGKKDVVYGIIVSGRPEDLPNVEKRVGMFINTLPLYASIDDNQDIVTWLINLQAGQVASRQFQHTALNETQRLAAC